MNKEELCEREIKFLQRIRHSLALSKMDMSEYMRIADVISNEIMFLVKEQYKK